MSFAENVRTLRGSKGLTQKELADKVGVAQPMITAYEKGTQLPNIINGVTLAKVLGTTCEELVK